MGREISLAEILSALDERERVVIQERLQGRSFRDIAPMIVGQCGQKQRGRPVTRQCVQQIERRAMAKLGSPFKSIAAEVLQPEREANREAFAEVGVPRRELPAALRYRDKAAIRQQEAESAYDGAVDAAMQNGRWTAAEQLAFMLITG